MKCRKCLILLDDDNNTCEHGVCDYCFENECDEQLQEQQITDDENGE